MKPQERELYIHRIISGCIKCNIHNRKGKEIVLLLKSASRYYKYRAEELYQETLKDGYLQGLKSEEQVIDTMVTEGLWDKEKQHKLDTLPKDLEQLKVKMFQLTFKSNEKRIVKQVCQKVKEDIANLQQERGIFAHLSAEGYAYLAKARFLIAMSLYCCDGRQYFQDEESYFESSGHIIDEALEFYQRNKLNEAQYRELARTEPWRTIWTTKSADGLFGIPAVDLSEEQKALVVWSNVYESIYKHSECPPDSVIEDDDLLDGWMIIQREKRNKDLGKNKVDELVSNDKVKNSDEVYVVANTMDDAKEIDNLNDNTAKMNKRERMNAIRKAGGQLNEVYMPDTQVKFNQEMNRMFKEHASGRV